MNEVPSSTSHCTFCVTRAKFDVRFRKSPVDSRGSLWARSRARTCDEEPGEDQGCNGEQDQRQHEVVVRREDAHHQDDEAGGGQDRSDGVEGMGRIRRHRVLDAAPEHEDHGDDHAPGTRTPPAS